MVEMLRLGQVQPQVAAHGAGRHLHGYSLRLAGRHGQRVQAGRGRPSTGPGGHWAGFQRSVIQILPDITAELSIYSPRQPQGPRRLPHHHRGVPAGADQRY